jgi:hypothetical protein
MTRKHWLFVFLVAVLLILSSMILLRQPLLDFVIRKVADKLEERFDTKLKIEEAGFLGFRDVYLKKVSIVPSGSDTLFTMQSLKARIRLRRLLRLEIRFNEIVIDSASLTLVKHNGTDNYSRFIKNTRKTPSDSAVVSHTGYTEVFNRLLNYTEDILSERITVRRVRISYRDAQQEEFVSIPELYSDGESIKSSIITSSIEGVNLWILSGTVDPDAQKYGFTVKRTRGAAFALPFIDRFDGIRTCFDEASVYYNSTGSNPVQANGRFSISNLMVNHWRIAPEDVIVDTLSATFSAGIAPDSIWLNPNSGFEMNHLPVKLYGSYTRVPGRRIRLNAGFEETDADLFFDALPAAIFSSLKGIKTTGKLRYTFYADWPRDNTPQLQFLSRLDKKNFRINSFGKENLAKMNAPFIYLAMENDQPVRSFTVGTDNPGFTPLENISPYLQNAVLTAEDPSFFNHAGFIPEAFRESMITNLQRGRFVRGGSTISMQLVKNVYLSRNKTIARKLEEALIVWLIEQNGLVPKERMFEVYLNVIEWGPGIYGIGEAAQFYFNKRPSELNLAESIYLASIIPAPKSFRRSFDENGQLKPRMAGYYKLVAGRLARRGKIAQSEADSLKPAVILSGAALNIVIPPDTLNEDDFEPELPTE